MHQRTVTANEPKESLPDCYGCTQQPELQMYRMGMCVVVRKGMRMLDLCNGAERTVTDEFNNGLYTDYAD
jgi:hypothetical protein